MPKLLVQMLTYATEQDTHELFLCGTCKVLARFSRFDGPTSPQYGKFREVTLKISRRKDPTNKPGWTDWTITVKDFNFAEFSNNLDVYELENGIEFMAESYRMHVKNII